MMTNSKVKSTKPKKKIVSNNVSDPLSIQKPGNEKQAESKPDYSSMAAEIKQIADPVSFDFLKYFFGID